MSLNLKDLKELKEVKVDVDGLRVGMHVSRLDRPWLETPLPFQGFKLKDQGDIERVKRYCSYVFVDIEKGIAPQEKDIIDQESEFVRPEFNPYRKLRQMVYEKTSEFEEELPRATQIYHSLNQTIQSVVKGIQEGKLLDVPVLNKGVEALIDSVVRNPTAVLWVNRLKTSDNYTYNHLITTAIWCAVLGRHLGFKREVLSELTLGGLLFDVGKAKLPTELLYKRRPLTDQEYHLVQKHVDFGVRILARSGKVPPSTLQMVATHHERWNGKGYPQGLKGEQIPVFGLIAGLIDSFAAMTAPRPFNPGISPHEAISEFYENRGTFFEPNLVEQFIQACGIYPTGSLVELNSGEVAVVVGLEGTYRLRPNIMLILDSEKKPYHELKLMNLSEAFKGVSIAKGLSPGAYGIDMEEISLNN